MNKQHILDEIRRLALAANGKVPGKKLFQSETGIAMSGWYPKYWLRWGDAIREAGLKPNSMKVAFSTECLIMKYVDLIRELQRFPLEGDLTIKRQQDKEFPNRGAFNGLGTKVQRATLILAHCRNKKDYGDIIPFCSEVLCKSPLDAPNAVLENREMGYVYLVQHGSRREYKIGKTFNPVRREGEIALQLPEKLNPIHYIKTDDPSGIETYWHARFADKRKEGEWFELKAVDVQAFKRWKKII